MKDVPPVDRTQRVLTDGSPVPEDGSHKKDRGDGQQTAYIVLTEEERKKGFVKPVRRHYIHDKCGVVTTMGRALAETYARDPDFYSGTFCAGCSAHFPLEEFSWEDGEPMDTLKQVEWEEKRKQQREEWRQQRIAQLKKELKELECNK